MITLLLTLYRRRWRRLYGDEVPVLVADSGLTPLAAVDLLRGAAVKHVRQRPVAVRVLLACFATAVVEAVSVRVGVTDNIVWAPTTPVRALTLTALLLAWSPVTSEVMRRAKRVARARAPHT